MDIKKKLFLQKADWATMRRSQNRHREAAKEKAAA
jgi:hypothetical protein